MRHTVSTHIQCTMKRTLPNSTLDKAPEVVLEAPYRPSTNDEADVHVTARSDSLTQPGDPDADHTSNKTGKLRVSAMCSAIQHCIPEPAPGKNTLSSEKEPAKVGSSQSATKLAKPAIILALKTVKEVSDVFPPLKSVAAGLSLIFEDVEVCSCVNLLFILTAHVTAHVASKK
jgi:hypothetical protein